MKFTISWLKEHLDTDASVAEIAETLTRIGLEVEAIEDRAAAFSAFTIARVIEATQHPNADRLRVCLVDTGTGEPVQVVCGAPNARTGMKGVFSPPGSYIPGKDITLGKGVIRGVESNGMLVSEAELQLSEDHDGIIELPEDAPVGMPYATYAKLDDATIEIAVTPNRADALGVSGVARDLAAAGLGTLRTPSIQPVRRAKAGEEILALDGRTYKLSDEQVVICDAHGVESLAGIMGGEASGCDENTVDVLVESALWDPLNIARSGRALGINSDARYRFERGVDPDFCRPGLDLATVMIIDLCGGE